MNKLFPLYTRSTEPQYNRPYYSQEWEPIACTEAALPPFQYTRTNTEYFYCGQVINGVETDITSKFRNNIEFITSWTPSTYCTINASDYTIWSLEFNSSYPTEYVTSNNFSFSVGQFINFRIDCTFTGGGDAVNILLRKGTTILETYALHTGKNEIAYKVLELGTDYNIQIKSVTVSGATSTITNGVYTCIRCLYDIHNDYLTYYGGSLLTSITEGVCTFKFQSTTKLYTDYCLVTSNDDVFSDQILIRIFSTYVDYADIYYQGGFIQTLYRYANVRRNPEPKITIIGDERNGIIVQEKVITATRYSVTMKCSEEQMDAFTTAAGATILITDQTGRTFTVYNLEISKPDWYRTNGIVTLTFDDNINVYTQNQTDL